MLFEDRFRLKPQAYMLSLVFIDNPFIVAMMTFALLNGFRLSLVKDK